MAYPFKYLSLMLVEIKTVFAELQLGVLRRQGIPDVLTGLFMFCQICCLTSVFFGVTKDYLLRLTMSYIVILPFPLLFFNFFQIRYIFFVQFFLLFIFLLAFCGLNRPSLGGVNVKI